MHWIPGKKGLFVKKGSLFTGRVNEKMHYTDQISVWKFVTAMKQK